MTTRLLFLSLPIIGRLRAQNVSLTCDSAAWQAKNSLVKCGSQGGIDGALEVADAGGWSHAYAEILVMPGSVYSISGAFFAEADHECDGSAKVRWCSPSIVVCPGAYQADFYNVGGCYVGLSPSSSGVNKWEAFVGYFSSTEPAVTVYVAQESSKYSSWLKDVRVSIYRAESRFILPGLFWFHLTHL